MDVPSNFRLGYACICTKLRQDGIFCSRTAKLSTIKTRGIEYLQELSIQNLKDLLVILHWNKDHGIRFMRLSSDLFPFATHEEYGYSLDFADDLLKQIGSYANEHGMRLTMHPGQFNVLSSPNEKVVDNTFLDLNYHCDILDRMNMKQNSVLIIHGGGVYGDKSSALERLHSNLLKLPTATKNRIVLENCEMSYTVEDLLPICESLQIPLVIDFHHDQINPSSMSVSNYFDRVFKIWTNRNIKPKVHVSNSIPGVLETASKTERRKHSDYISYFHPDLLLIKFPIDVMLECKMKEQAILQLLPLMDL